MPSARPVSLDEWEVAAKARLPRGIFDYIAGGAGAEHTLAANEAAFDRWSVWPRVLRRAATPATATDVLGSSLAFPIVIAPWAFQGQVHPDGEMATARAAAALGTAMCVSSTVLDRQGDIAATGAALWWQLYVWRDRAATAALLQGAAEAGYRAVVWTVDVSALGLRYRDVRSGFQLPVGPAGTAQEFDPELSWADLAWIRAQVPELPIAVKGILHPDDARAAVDHGADAVIVSNHGGRQLDHAPASLDALPGVVEAVSGRVPVLVDGGIREGVDVLIALALGAAAVLVARPTAWGLAVDGQAGVEAVLGFLRDGLVNAMTNAGCRSLADIERTLLRPA
jgi:isopentenyl diphosphate isomerase/L-lactate dehydrogenase-like FMN-dependent dehydrogenase